MAFWKRLNSEKILAVMATIVSVCALVVSVFQVQSERKQQYASVWPNVSISVVTRLDQDSTTNQWAIIVANKGVGPAIVEKIELWYNGKLFTSEAAFGEKVLGVSSIHRVSGSINQIWEDKVIAANEELEWIRVNGYEPTEKFSKAISEGLIQARIQYKSVYDERWEVNYNRGKRLVIKLDD